MNIDDEIKRKVKEMLHVYYVSLKNNKSRETLKQFLISLSDFFDTLINKYLEKKDIEVPESPLKRLELFMNYVNEEKIKKILNEYRKWRRCIYSDIEILNEYRRTFTAICHLQDEDYTINQKKLKEIIEMAKVFYNYMIEKE